MDIINVHVWLKKQIRTFILMHAYAYNKLNDKILKYWKILRNAANFATLFTTNCSTI